MCIGIPLQVVSVQGRRAQCASRSESREVDIVLVEPVQPGDWLLVFLDAARERIDAARAAEVQAALDLVAGALAGTAMPAPEADPGFALPSAMNAAQLAALTGQRP